MQSMFNSISGSDKGAMSVKSPVSLSIPLPLKEFVTALPRPSLPRPQSRPAMPTSSRTRSDGVAMSSGRGSEQCVRVTLPAVRSATTNNTCAASSPFPSPCPSPCGSPQTSPFSSPYPSRSASPAISPLPSRSASPTIWSPPPFFSPLASRSSSPQRERSASVSSSSATSLVELSKEERKQRREKAMQAVRAKEQWQLFTHLGFQSEKEIVEAVQYMRKVVSALPDLSQRDATLATLSQESEKDILSSSQTQKGRRKPPLPIEATPNVSRALSEVDCIRLESIALSPSPSRRQLDSPLVDISQKPIDLSFVCELIALFRRGEQISLFTVQYILFNTIDLLCTLPNTTRLNVPTQGQVTVLGDLHGQLPDLLHILDENGLPSEENKFVFNGDFVDRGPDGVEIVCILFSMLLAVGPENVALNRGNHEDADICRLYGFRDEVMMKYNSSKLFDVFTKAFTHLPLFTLIDETVLIVHGGVVHDHTVSLAELDQIPRAHYRMRTPGSHPRRVTGERFSGEAHLQFLQLLQFDSLWSDPKEDFDGFGPSKRGAGVWFGADITRAFMARNDLFMIVRSHECCKRGFELPFSRSQRDRLRGLAEDLPLRDEPLLCTVFSASNYRGSNNDGAVLKLMRHPFTHSLPVYREAFDSLTKEMRLNRPVVLHYGVKRFKTSEAFMRLEDRKCSSLLDVILRHKSALDMAFEAHDDKRTGTVSRDQWAAIMQRVTRLDIQWRTVIDSVVPSFALSSKHVNYHVFVASVAHRGTSQKKNKNVLYEMYEQRHELENLFFFFDRDNDGIISLAEFKQRCEEVDEFVGDDHILTMVDNLAELMDFDGSGAIDINEFFETMRLFGIRRIFN